MGDMHVYMISRKREDIYMEWIFCFRKSNRRNTNKIERRMLPSEVQKLKTAKKLQKSLKVLCDSEEDDDSSDNTFVTLRSKQNIDSHHRMKRNANLNQQKEIIQLDITDSSENENTKDEKTKSIQYRQDSSKSSMHRISKSRKSKIYSDSDDSIELSSNQTTKQKHTSKPNIKTDRIVNSHNSSDNESDKDVSTNRASNVTKSLSKNIKQQSKKKDANSCDAKSTKDKANKHQDLTSESEDEEVKFKKQNKKKHSTNHMSYNEGKKHVKKHDKSSKERFSTIQENESDSSSSKEFQKKKFQKVNHNKYSMRRLANLEIDYTKSSTEENSASKNEDNINDQDMNLDNAKEFVSDCKKIISNFQKYINSVEELYGKKDEELFMLRTIKKINKMWPNLQKVQKNLTTFYQSKNSKNRKSSVRMKRSFKETNDDEESSKEMDVSEKREMSESKICNSRNEEEGSKNVSECDSEEIFSADESRTLQKMRITDDKVNTSNIENNLNANVCDTKSDDEDKESIGSSKDEDRVDKNNADLRNKLSSSPLLGTSKEKITNTERSTKKQIERVNNNEAPLTHNIDLNDKQSKSGADSDVSDNEIENSPLGNGKKMTLQNSSQDNSANTPDIINESMDMFDASYSDIPKTAEEDKTEAQETAIKTNCDKIKSSSKIKSLDTSLQEKVSSEDDTTSPVFHDNEEDNLLDQEKVASESVTNENIHNLEELNVEKTNPDDLDTFLDDDETLTKKCLLESESDSSTTILLDANVTTKSTEEKNNRKNKAENDDLDDVNSSSTVILSFPEKTNTDDRAKVKNKSTNEQTDEKSHEEMDSLNDNAKTEEAFKKALLESNSDESSIPFSSDAEENENKEIESNSSEQNAKSKRALLASSNTESSSSEPVESNVATSDLSNYSNKSKRKFESDDDSRISRMKRKRIKLNKSHHYWKDKKLRMLCEIRLERLSKKVLRRHLHALKKSREYLEQKAFKRYQDLSLKSLFIVLHNLK